MEIHAPNLEVAVQSGRIIRLDEMTQHDVDIEDIAHSLTHICRFNGHTEYHYSVAAHCLLVADILERHQMEDLALPGLLHDAAEAYLGDIVAPLKRVLPSYLGLEHRVEACIVAKFDVPGINDSKVKWADYLAYQIEVHQLLPNYPAKWKDAQVGFVIEDYQVYRLSPSATKKAFIERFLEYRG